MNITKIPSSNIYEVDSNTALVSQNQIENVQITSNNYIRKFGENVLSKEYIINFYEYNNGKLVYVANDSQKTDFYFTSEPIANGNYKVIEESPILNLDIGKIIQFEFDQNTDKIYKYVVYIKKYWSDSSIDPETEQLRITEESLVDFPNYDAINHKFKIDIGTYSNNLNGGIVVAFRGFEGDIFEYLTKMTIRVEGEYFDTEDVTQTFGVINSGNSILLPNNELTQIGSKISGSHAQQTISNKVIRVYRNGKEVYTIKCSVGEYYDIYRAKAIDPYDTNYPATFEKHEIVEPYVFTSQGEVPLSEKADGTPKRFEIIGIDFSYKGVVWQELTLQEYIE
jgi:hypothetical protein